MKVVGEIKQYDTGTCEWAISPTHKVRSHMKDARQIYIDTVRYRKMSEYKWRGMNGDDDCNDLTT